MTYWKCIAVWYDIIRIQPCVPVIFVLNIWKGYDDKMKKGNKNTVHIMFTIVMSIIMASVVAILIVVNSRYDEANAPVENTSSLTDESSIDDNSTSADRKSDNRDNSVSEGTQGNVTDTTVAQTQAADAAIQGGYWYLYDEKNVICYVFSFKGDGKVDLAMFDDSNISGEDAKYFSGYSSYTMDGNTVHMDDMPDTFKQKSFELVIDGANLKYNGLNLGHHQELSMDYAIGYKMASELKGKMKE